MARRHVWAVLAVSLLGSGGCGSPGVDEPVSETHEAIDIAGWNDLVAMGTTGSYKLKGHINAAGKTWTPKSFSGTLDGGNFTIQNLTISGGSFFSSLSNATVRRLRFENLTITGNSTVGIGGLASAATNTTIESCAVNMNVNVTATMVGGILGTMTNGSIYRSYAKGTISGSMFFAGGLVGTANKTSDVSAPTISESYAVVTVNPDTGGSFPVNSGGILGSGSGAVVYDVYAVGNVKGRGGVGGIAGRMNCTEARRFQMFKTIYRGDVVDENWKDLGGWSGGVGTFGDCIGRFEQNFYDRTLDPSSNRANHQSIRGYTSVELRSPTSVTGGVFCEPDDLPPLCGDNTWTMPPWTAGNESMHHALQNLPGGVTIQPP